MNTKTIWITGASSGIGKALALEWASPKTHLILTARNEEKLNQLKTECEQKGATCTVVPMDLFDVGEIPKTVERVLKKHTQIDILVNNAGMSQRSAAKETPIENDRKIMELNFFSKIAFTKAVLPEMLKRGEGQIIAISSVVGKFGFPLRTAYSASKHAIQGYFEALRAEVEDLGIKVMIVSPGRVKTDISYNALRGDGTKHGQLDPGQANGMPVEICAKQIIAAAQKGKRDILIGRKELLMVYIRRFLPFLFFRLVKNIDNK